MKKKEIECYEVEVKILVRKECSKKELKEEVEDNLNSISYQIEELKVKVK